MKKIFLLLVAVSMVFMFVGSASADLSSGLVAYYPFNGNANDESGNGNNGIVNGATLTYDRFGNPDSAYSFNGISDYIDIGNNVKPPFPVSVSVWVNANDLDASGCGLAGVVRNDQYDDGGYRYGLTVSVNDGYLRAHYFEGFSAPWNRIGYISNDALISAGNWYNLVVIFNAHKDIQLFVNGVEFLGSYSGTGSGMSYSGSGNGAIGMFKTNNPVRTCYFNGIVDELRFYNRALAEAEILQLYNEGNAILSIAVGDFDGNGHDDLCGLNASYEVYYTTNLSTWTQIPGNLKKLFSGDFNNDGNDDLAGISASGNIYYTTNLSAWSNIPGNLATMVSGNFDGIGGDDLAGLSASGNIYYTTNLSTWTQIPGNLKKLFSGDFNNDGNDDLAGVSLSGNIWYTTNLSTWTQIPGTLESLVVGDFDNDGYDDLAGVSPSGNIWYTTNLSTWTQIPGTLKSLVVGDFNNDGNDDLAGISPSENIYYTNNLNTWTQIPGSLTTLVSGNFDGIGGDDLSGISASGNIWYTKNLSTWTQIPGTLAPY